MTTRLFTIVLIATAVGVGIGWFSGKASLSRHFDALLHGNAHYISARDSTMWNSWEDKSDRALLDTLKRGPIQDVFNLYRYSNDVNMYLDYQNSDDTAHGMARELMKHMDCDSTDAYFTRFNEVYIYGDDSSYQEAGTAENESFRLFIDSMILEQKRNGDQSDA